MNRFIAPSILTIAFTSQFSLAATFQPDFTDKTFPGTQFTVTEEYNHYYSENYGITVENVYLYIDDRDTFDKVGIAVGTTDDQQKPNQVGRVNFLDTTDFVKVDYFTIRKTTYSAYDAYDNLIDQIIIGPFHNDTYTFSGGIINYITFESSGGYGNISNLEYNYDGVTDGVNDDVDVPVPAAFWLFASALAGLSGLSRCKRQ